MKLEKPAAIVQQNNEDMKNATKVTAAIGLALGGIFGMLGTMAAEENIQAAFWAGDGVGLPSAIALLA